MDDYEESWRYSGLFWFEDLLQSKRWSIEEEINKREDWVFPAKAGRHHNKKDQRWTWRRWRHRRTPSVREIAGWSLRCFRLTKYAEGRVLNPFASQGYRTHSFWYRTRQVTCGSPLPTYSRFLIDERENLCIRWCYIFT